MLLNSTNPHGPRVLSLADPSYQRQQNARADTGIMVYTARAMAENAGAANPAVRWHRACLNRKGRLLGISATVETVVNPTTNKFRFRVVGRNATTKLPTTLLQAGMEVPTGAAYSTGLIQNNKEFQCLFPAGVDIDQIYGECFIQFASEIFNTSSAQSGGSWSAAYFRGEAMGSGGTSFYNDLAWNGAFATIDTAFPDNPAVGSLSGTDNFASIGWRWIWEDRQ